MTTLLSGKLAAKHASHREVESMKAVARAHANRNLAEFRTTLRDYRDGSCNVSSFPPFFVFLVSLFIGVNYGNTYLYQLRFSEFSLDPIIRQHLSALFDRLLEQNLLRIVEPYSVVEIAHVAKLVDQGIQQVETKYAHDFFLLLLILFFLFKGLGF